MSDHLYVYDFLDYDLLGEVLAVASKLNKQYSLAEGRESGKKGVGIGFGRQHALLTLARASTLAPFLSKIRIMSV